MLDHRIGNRLQKGSVSRLPTAVLVSVLSLAVVCAAVGLGTLPARASSSLALPFRAGETWYICQGYNTGTHVGVIKFGLDLSVDAESPGAAGCTPATANASTGRPVLAPASGQIVLHDDDRGGVCVNLDNGKSMWIGHLSDMAPYGPIGRNGQLGTVAAPGDVDNGNYAHIHVQIHPGPGCAASGQSIPFDDAHGTRFEGAPDLPDTGDVNQHSGTPLTKPKKHPAVDVYMLVDLSGSFSDDLPNFKVQAPDIVSTLTDSNPNTRFGLGKFEDYPIPPFGSGYAGDKAYERLLDLTFDTDTVLSTISGLFTRDGVDWPQSQLVALYQAATGAGQDLSGAGWPEASIPPDQQANFRDGASKLFLLWTDAPFHNPGDPGSIPYPGPSFDETVSAILAVDPPKVVGISSGSDAVPDLQAMAAATEAFAPADGVDCNADGVIDIAAGDPLVCSISPEGEGIGEAIIALVEAVTELPVPMDVAPQSCPNPLNVRARGVLPVAILGTENFDTGQVDPVSVLLEGVSPLRWSLEDVATPFEPFIGKEDAYDCNDYGPDGYLDLTLKYKAQEVVAALGEVSDGDVLVLDLTGNLKEESGGTPFAGQDVVVIVTKH